MVKYYVLTKFPRSHLVLKESLDNYKCLLEYYDIFYSICFVGSFYLGNINFSGARSRARFKPPIKFGNHGGMNIVRPNATKCKTMLLPCNYCKKTCHPLEKCYKEFGKLE